VDWGDWNSTVGGGVEQYNFLPSPSQSLLLQFGEKTFLKFFLELFSFITIINEIFFQVIEAIINDKFVVLFRTTPPPISDLFRTL